jgi:rubrerythrin
MPIRKTRDVLDQIVCFHKNASGFLHLLGDQSPKERIRLVLDYISRHERHVQEVLQDYEEEVTDDVLQSPFQEPPDIDFYQCIENVKLNEDLSVDDLIGFACMLDDCVIAHYQKVAECTENPTIQEIFNELLEMENREKLRMVKQSMRLIDL